MLSKSTKFDYFSKVGEWIPKYFQSVLDVTLRFPAPWEPFLAIFLHIWASRGTQKALSSLQNVVLRPSERVKRSKTHFFGYWPKMKFEAKYHS